MWCLLQGARHVELIRTIPCNVRVGRGLSDDLMLVSHFTDGKNKAQRGKLTCSRSHRKLMLMLGLAPSVYIEIRHWGQ